MNWIAHLKELCPHGSCLLQLQICQGRPCSPGPFGSQILFFLLYHQFPQQGLGKKVCQERLNLGLVCTNKLSHSAVPFMVAFLDSSCIEREHGLGKKARWGSWYIKRRHWWCYNKKGWCDGDKNKVGWGELPHPSSLSSHFMAVLLPPQDENRWSTDDLSAGQPATWSEYVKWCVVGCS